MFDKYKKILPLETEKEAKGKFKKEAVSIALIILSVFTFRSVFFEPFKIPSGSMIPTLMIGDFILVNKYSYGFKVPFSDMFGDPIYLGTPDNPKRGDVIVFKFPEDPDINFIKRVIGLPGETIEIRNKVVFINGKAIDMKEFSGEKIMADMDEKFVHYPYTFYKAQTGEHFHEIQTNDLATMSLNFGPVTIEKGTFFVMGDNRDHSHDSRGWGFVPHGHIKGKALLVWFSMNLPGGNDAPSFKFRPWRIGQKIK